MGTSEHVVSSIVSDVPSVHRVFPRPARGSEGQGPPTKFTYTPSGRMGITGATNRHTRLMERLVGGPSRHRAPPSRTRGSAARTYPVETPSTAKVSTAAIAGR